ncbi:MAG: PASTA domain-containing protein, partial [Bacillota bacterium]
KPGEKIEVDDKIDLIISKGIEPNMVKMPLLVGKDFKNAESKIESVGLRIGKVEREESSRFKEDQVISQSYQSGENIPEDSRVDLVVSDGLINSEENETHSINVNITVRSSEKVNVKIVVTDLNGEDVVYNKEHTPGDYISESINSVGKTEVKVYFDEKLRHSKTIGG